MFTPIPIALVETNEDFARAVLQELLPQFIVVHVCLNVETATFELATGYAGPASGLPHSCSAGSNMQVPPEERSVPRAVVIGASFEDEDILAIRDSVERGLPGAATVPLSREGAPAADVHSTMRHIRDTLQKLVDDGVLKHE